MSLAPFVGEIPSLALAVAGKGALIALAALGVAAALRRASAASRHLVLALAAAALLVLPLVTAFLPAWDLPVLPRVEPAEPQGFSPGPPAVQASTPVPGTAPGQPGSEPHTRGVARPAQSSPGLLPLLPLAVSLLLLIRLALMVPRLSRLRTGSRPAPAEWQAFLDQQRRRLGIDRSVRLAVSAAVAVPVTFGWRRPMVLIPEVALGWEDQPLREALVHELSHVRRGDWPVQMMARAACALHWFDPLAWMLCRRLLLEAELACDDQVLQAGTGAEGYAERLVALARQVRGAARRPAAAVAFARPSGLASRVDAILDSGRRRGGPGRLAIAGASVTALVLLLLVAPAHLVRAASPSTREIPSPEPRFRATSTFPVSSLPPLLRVAWEGNLAEVRRLLDAGADPNQAVPRHGTPLILAAAQGHGDVVEALLAAGADPARAETVGERPMDLQRTPLGAAARQGDLEVVRRLLAAGAPVDLAPRGDATPLMSAAERGHRDVVDALLAAGADPKAVIRGDGTPLIAAARGGDPAVVRRLLDAGADPDVYVPGDETALQQAVENGHAEAARLLLDAGADPLAGEALEQSVQEGVSGALQEDSVREGIRSGREEGKRAALIAATAAGDVDAVRFLLQEGVDPNTVIPGDGTPLIVAAREGQTEVVRLLLTVGAHVDQVVPGDENPLIQAAWNGRLEVARLLLEAGADPNVRVVADRSPLRPDGKLRTPLRMARRGGHRDLETLLLEHGAKD